MSSHVIGRAKRITKIEAGVLNGLYTTLETSGRKPWSRTKNHGSIGGHLQDWVAIL